MLCLPHTSSMCHLLRPVYGLTYTQCDWQAATEGNSFLEAQRNPWADLGICFNGIEHEDLLPLVVGIEEAGIAVTQAPNENDTRRQCDEFGLIVNPARVGRAESFASELSQLTPC